MRLSFIPTYKNYLSDISIISTLNIQYVIFSLHNDVRDISDSYMLPLK